MIKLKKIQIDSFKLFADTELALPESPDVAFIKGSNRDSYQFDSNSVGKSTLVNAILYGLYGKNINRDSLENLSNAYTKQKPNVTITFEKEQQEFIIKIDDSTKTYKLFIDGTLQEVTGKTAIFKEVEQIIGLSFFTLSKLIYISPNATSLFSDNDPANQSKFIKELLSLEFVSGIHKESSADLKSYKGEVQMKLKEVSLLQKQVDNLNEQLRYTPEIEHRDFEQEIETLEQELTEEKDVESSLKSQLEGVKSECNKFSTQVSDLKSEVRTLKKDLKRQQDLIDGGICPTCSQKTSDLEVTVRDSELKSLQKSYDEAEEKLIQAQSDKKGVEDLLNEAHITVSKLESKINSVKEAQAKHNSERSMNVVRERLQQQLSDSTTELVEAQESLSELQNMVYCIELIKVCSSAKGFVRERINLFLRLFNVQLQELSKSLLGGSVKVEVTKQDNGGYALSVEDSFTEFSYQSLSSGYRARIDLLLSLALNRAIEELTGVSINILMIDELLSSIDASGVESIEEMLTKIRTMFPDKHILLISHNQNLSAENKVLEVVREDNESKLVWKD